MKRLRDDDPHCPWHQRARLALRRSLRWRLVLVFLVLALALTVTFIGGVQKALSVGWRAAARPLLVDYVDRLAQEVGSPPSTERCASRRCTASSARSPASQPNTKQHRCPRRRPAFQQSVRASPTP